ncbi:MAG: ABC transporter permease [Spirochaetales bacterium]|nr:ABC transporter permease [Spirochaetales bacterium]
MRIWERYGIYFLALTTLLIFAILTPNILSQQNILNLLSQVSMVAIAGVGMTFAITAGGFDLSIGSQIALATCILGLNIPKYGLIPSLGILLVAGILLGIFNGFIITKLKIQTFVATLATMTIYRGLALLYTQGHDATIYNYLDIKIFSSGKVGIVPVPVLMMLGLYLIATIIYRWTRFGVWVRGIGSGEEAAHISGIPVNLVMMGVFVMTSVTTMIAGTILTAQLLTGNGRLGQGFELEVITATILGGTALTGGKGSLWGTLVAAIMLGIIKNGLNLLGVPDFYQRLVTGLILIAALSVNTLNARLVKRSTK